MSHPFVPMGAMLALLAAAPAVAAPSTATPQKIAAQAPAAGKAAPRPATRADIIKTTSGNFQKVDTNSDGSLSTAEIDAASVRMQQQAQAQIGVRIQQQFTKLDTDRNGQLSLAEFRAAVPARAPSTGVASATAMKQLDSNKDGKISADEYRAPLLAAFDRADTDKNGTISPAERSRAAASRQTAAVKK